MAIEVFQNFNVNLPQQKIRQSSYGDYMPYSPEQLLDEFASSDEEVAKGAGLFLLAGITVREFLKKISNGFFSKYFSKKQDVSTKEIMDIAGKMVADKGLDKKGLRLMIAEHGDDAYFNHVDNVIKVTKNTLISLPHEIGHAVQEHSTTILKKLQRSRGRYAMLAMLLYGLGRSKSNEPDAKTSTTGKIRDFLYKYNLLVPLIAFSPELITEFAASKIGIDYLKQAKASSKLISAARKHYAVAFCTYLSLPLFAVMDNLIYRGAMSRK